MCYVIEYRDEMNGLQTAHCSTPEKAMQLVALVSAEGLLPRVREVQEPVKAPAPPQD